MRKSTNYNEITLTIRRSTLEYAPKLIELKLHDIGHDIALIYADCYIFDDHLGADFRLFLFFYCFF